MIKRGKKLRNKICNFNLGMNSLNTSVVESLEAAYRYYLKVKLGMQYFWPYPVSVLNYFSHVLHFTKLIKLCPKLLLKHLKWNQFFFTWYLLLNVLHIVDLLTNSDNQHKANYPLKLIFCSAHLNSFQIRSINELSSS